MMTHRAIRLFCTDLDGTLLGNPESTRRFQEAWENLPKAGRPLLAFHYIYEVFLSENQLDHNPKITGRVTRWFAWGDFHLQHHVHPKQNIGLMITLWDRLFGTANDPQPGMAWRRIEAHRDRLAERAATNELQPSVLAQ